MSIESMSFEEFALKEALKKLIEDMKRQKQREQALEEVKKLIEFMELK